MAGLIGQHLGNYRLVRLLGRGGFAEVYLGEHIHLGAQAAIKVLHTHLVSDDVENFRTEARTIVRLVHPHIVRVLDFDVKDGVPFLVMDYAPNGSLREHHPRGTRLALPLVVSYVKQVAEALQYAHDQRLVHRDVKPDNMLLGRRNEVVLSDFGIATIAHRTSSQSVQVMAGTIPYMAPEQIQGKPRLASDQYALGIVVYEWLSGDRPFQGSFTEIASQHVLAPPPPLAEKIATISPEVEQVVLTALAKDPHQRFGSVHAFATALEQANLPKPDELHQSEVIWSGRGGVDLSGSTEQVSEWPLRVHEEGKQTSGQVLQSEEASVAVPAGTATPASSKPDTVSVLDAPSTSPSQPTPLLARLEKLLEVRKDRRTLMDFLLPAPTSPRGRLLYNAVLIVGFSAFFMICTHLYIIFSAPIAGFAPGAWALLDILGVLVTGAMLGKRRSTIAILLYVVAGAVGLPVLPGVSLAPSYSDYTPITFIPGILDFTSRGDLSSRLHDIYLSYLYDAGFLSSPTHILLFVLHFLSYPIAAFVIGLLCERRLDRRFRTSALAIVPGFLIMSITGLYLLRGVGIATPCCQFIAVIFLYNVFISAGWLMPYTWVLLLYLPQVVIPVLLFPFLWRLPFVKRRMAA